MFNTEAPNFPEYVDDEYHHVSTITLPAFAGMQITNGPYGAVSSDELSTGETHAVSDKSLDPAIFRAVVSWIIANAPKIRELLFPALVDQYWEMRDIILADSDAEDEEEQAEVDALVPEIEKPEELATLCGLVAIHIGGQTANGEPRYGIELGCNWEQEHGAGVRFVGLRVVQSGDASDAFRFPKKEA